jgi:PAS domain S-box-containing protein
VSDEATPHERQRVPPRQDEVLTEAMLRVLIEQVPLTTYIDRLDELSSNVYTSPQLEATLGYTLQEWVEDEELFTKVVHPDDRDAVLAEHERTAETGEPFRMEYRMVAKDGSVRWFIDEANVINDALGSPEFHYGCMLDITERKQLESTLREREAQIRAQKEELESLLEISPTGIVTLDDTGCVTSWNLAAEELFGYPCEDALGRRLDDLVKPLTGGASEEARGPGRVHAVTSRRGRGAAAVDVEVTSVPVGNRRGAGRLVVYHDIGELQRARQVAEEAMHAKSAFLATMSHEIRTPMNAVIGMTELLLDTDLTPEQRGFADVVRMSGEALLGIINDILDFSKIEAGRVALERTPFELRDCVESAIDLVAARAADKELDVAC